MNSSTLGAALIGAGIGYAVKGVSEPEERAGVDTDTAALQSTVKRLTASLAAANEELIAIDNAKSRLKQAYDELVADGGEINASFYQRTIESLNERISFLSEYMSAELGRSIEHVSTHGVKKLPGLYIDPVSKFTNPLNDPSFYRGPNGDIRLHNAMTLPCYADVMYENAQGQLAIDAPSSIHSNSGAVGFRLHAGRKVRFRATNPSAANIVSRYRRHNMGYVGGTPASVESENNDTGGKVYNSYTLIEFDEDVNVHDLLDKVAVLAFRRYSSVNGETGVVNSTFETSDKGGSYAGFEYTVIPARRNVLLVSVTESYADLRLSMASDFGFEAIADIDLKVKSINKIYLPSIVHGASRDASPVTFTGTAGATAGGLRPTVLGTDLDSYNDRMFIL